MKWKPRQSEATVKEVRRAVTRGKRVHRGWGEGACRGCRCSSWMEWGLRSVFTWKNALSWTLRFVSSIACTFYHNKKCNKKWCWATAIGRYKIQQLKSHNPCWGTGCHGPPRTPSSQPCKGGVLPLFHRLAQAHSKGQNGDLNLAAFCLHLRISSVQTYGSLGRWAWQASFYPLYRYENEGLH